MSDGWDAAGLPQRRGRGDSGRYQSAANSSLAVARQLVDDLNTSAFPHESTFGDGLEALIQERGLTLVEDISLERQEYDYRSDFNGFLLVLADDTDAPPFAAIRLRNESDQKTGRAQHYAELWRPDRG